MKKGIIPHEKEILSATQQLNEYIMISLRTTEGLDLNKVENVIGDELRAVSKKFIERGLMIEENDQLKLTKNGKLLADGIAADLFFEEPKITLP
jgi:oxygen-independent coproporphyrinogen-3 oxidase